MVFAIMCLDFGSSKQHGLAGACSLALSVRTDRVKEHRAKEPRAKEHSTSRATTSTRWTIQ